MSLLIVLQQYILLDEMKHNIKLNLKKKTKNKVYIFLKVALFLRSSSIAP